MSPLLISALLALVGFFVSKKKGATSTQAALVGAAAGLGSYYVATETDWGKSLFSSTNDGSWEVAKDADGNIITDANGKQVYVPKGEKAVVDSSGKPVVASDGTWFTKTLDTTASVLKSWGGAGTAAVVGTAAVASSSSSSLQKYLPWLLIGGAAILILK